MSTTLHRFWMRRGAAVEWSAQNTILGPGEWGLETDTGKAKVGNGVTTWSLLPYSVIPAPSTAGQALISTGAGDFAYADVGTQVELTAESVARAAGDAARVLTESVLASAGTLVVRSRVTGDANPRWSVKTNGLMEWGGGTGALDTSLTRSSVGTLTASGDVVVNSLLADYVQDKALTRAYINMALGNGIGVINRTNVGAVPLTVKGMAAQTADLHQWQDSTATTLARMSAGGVASVARLTVGTGVYDPVADITSARIDAYSSGAHALTLFGGGNPPTAGTVDAFVIESTTAAGLFVGPAIQLRGHSGNGVDPYPFAAIQGYKGSTTAGDYSSGFRVRTSEASGGLLDRLDVGPGATFIYPRTNNDYALIVQGLSGQAAALTVWRNSLGSALAYVDTTPNLVLNGATSTVTWTAVASGSPASLGIPGSSPPSTLDLRLPVGGMRFINNAYTNVEGQVTNSGEWSFPSNSAPVVPITVIGAASQSGSLTQWMDSTATVIASVAPSGALNAAGLSVTAGGAVRTNYVTDLTNAKGYLDTSVAGWSFRMVERNASNVVLGVLGMTGQTADLTRWYDGTGALVARVDNIGQFWTSVVSAVDGTGSYISLGGGETKFVNRTAAHVPLTVQGAASQSGDLTRWVTSAGAVLATVIADGRMVWPGSGTIGNVVGPPYLDFTSDFYRFLDSGYGHAGVAIEPVNTSVTLTARGASGQTGDLQNWQDSTGAKLAYVQAGGNIITSQDVYAHVATAEQVYMGTGGPSGQAGLIFGITSPTNLYLTSATTLRTDGNLQTAGYLAVGVVSSGWALNNGSAAGGGGVGGVLSYGTGAPVNASGANGDIYLRVDGGALTTIYQRRAGAWVGIV